jgi:hypothetical protein
MPKRVPSGGTIVENSDVAGDKTVKKTPFFNKFFLDFL